MADDLLTFHMEHQLGPLSIKVAFRVHRPWTMLFGPSGSGKTTVLRTLAGFVRPNAGELLFGIERKVLLRTAERRFVRADCRPIRGVGQGARLFPHLTVKANLGFGAASAPQTHSGVIDEALDLFHLRPLAERLPRDLSGGEQQRACVARAIVAAAIYDGPEVLLLLDEPFSGLGDAQRDTLLSDLKPWLVQRKIPVLSVSHDVGEAFLLDAEIIRLHEGRIITTGPVTEVLQTEREAMLRRLHVVREEAFRTSVSRENRSTPGLVQPAPAQD